MDNNTVNYKGEAERDVENYETPSVSTEAIVIRKNGDFGHQILLTKKENEPFKGHLAFPGGFVGYGEDPESTVLKGLEKKCGIVGSDPQLADVSGRATRDPQKHIVSIFYSVLLSEQEALKVGKNKTSAKWYNLYDIWTLKDKFAYDFRMMLWKYIEDKFP